MAAKKKKKKSAAKKSSRVTNPAKVSVKLIASPMNTKKKVYDVCVSWAKGNVLQCGVVLASNEAEAKRLAKATAKKLYGITL